MPLPNDLAAITGDHVLVYPGHPLVLSLIIMRAFKGYASANAPTEHGWCQALADARIPGAGDHVGAAMRVLAIGDQGGTIDQMVDSANDYWLRGNAGGHHANVEAGRLQAKALEPVFRAEAGAWFASSAATRQDDHHA